MNAVQRFADNPQELKQASVRLVARGIVSLRRVKKRAAALAASAQARIEEAVQEVESH